MTLSINRRRAVSAIFASASLAQAYANITRQAPRTSVYQAWVDNNLASALLILAAVLILVGGWVAPRASWPGRPAAVGHLIGFVIEGTAGVAVLTGSLVVGTSWSTAPAFLFFAAMHGFRAWDSIRRAQWTPPQYP